MVGWKYLNSAALALCWPACPARLLPPAQEYTVAVTLNGVHAGSAIWTRAHSSRTLSARWPAAAAVDSDNRRSESGSGSPGRPFGVGTTVTWRYPGSSDADWPGTAAVWTRAIPATRRVSTRA